jgi:type IV pilus assembly protein PilN
MIKINLLPYRERKKNADKKRQLIIMGASFGSFLVLIMCIHLYEVFSKADLEKRVQAAEAKASSLGRIAGEIDRVKGDKSVLEKKIAIIKTLEENRLKPVLVLDELTSLIPKEQIWLTMLGFTENDIRIEGTARDNGAVAIFMKNLERSSFIKTVDLIASKQLMIGSNKLQAFTISCSFKRGS